MLLLIVLGFAPLLMLLTLGLALYLTVIELLETRPHFLWWFWWLLLVFMTHFIGYLIFRAYVFYGRWTAHRG